MMPNVICVGHLYEVPEPIVQMIVIYMVKVHSVTNILPCSQPPYGAVAMDKPCIGGRRVIWSVNPHAPTIIYKAVIPV